MPLDFTNATDLFMGSEEELARALDVSVADLRAARAAPVRVPRSMMAHLGQILRERGAGMKRVGEMIREDYG